MAQHPSVWVIGTFIQSIGNGTNASQQIFQRDDERTYTSFMDSALMTKAKILAMDWYKK